MAVEISTNKELSKYIEELENDVKLTEFNLREKSLLASSLWSKWLSYLFLEKSNLDKIQLAKTKCINQNMSEDQVQDSVLGKKNEENLLANNDTLKQLNSYAKMTQSNIDFIERALQIWSNFGFQIKNTIEVLKLNLH